ncbi:type IV secretion system protein [Thioalkalivibrio sp. ALE23]|uniref:type IV secretion system protein n=1 Tax=Thioalkalivibrio sp. ALE23 TaxID=1265495 RepID=UPI00036FAEA0|nr:type IV secretion system protein [Thioalkalivibrio sp. ALE23]
MSDSAVGQNLTQDLTNFLEVVLAPLATMEAFAVNIGDRMGGISIMLMDIFLVIAVVVMGIRFALSNSLVAQDMFFELFKFIIFWSALYWMIGNYGELIDRFYDGFDVLAQTIESEAASEVVEMANRTDMAAKHQESISQSTRFDDDDPHPPGLAGAEGMARLLLNMAETRSEVYAATRENASNESGGFWDAGPTIAAYADKFFTDAWVTLMTLLAGAVMFAYVLVYSIVVIVLWFLKSMVIAIGPVMLAMFLVPYLSYIADGWVRIAIIVGLMYTMLSLVMALFTGLMLGQVGLAGIVGVDMSELENKEIRALFEWGEFMPLLLIAVVGMYIMIKVPQFVEILMMGRGIGGMAGGGSGVAAAGLAKGGAMAGGGTLKASGYTAKKGGQATSAAARKAGLAKPKENPKITHS